MSADFTMTLTSGDGLDFTFACGPEETIAQAAHRADVMVPHVCGSGSCGACQGTCESGDYDLAEHSPAALPEAAKDSGGILLCSTRPRSDMKLRIAASSLQLSAGPIPQRSCTVTEITAMGGDVYKLALTILPDPEDGIGPLFEPGQFMELQIPGTDRWRAYSLSNAPNWDGILEFMVRRQPGGQFSHWLTTQARAGDTILTRGAQGSFGVQAGSLNRRMFIAGGTGVAPFLSILRQNSEFGEDHPTHLLFGLNDENALFATEDLTDLQNQLPSLTCEICLWKPSASWAGTCGTPADRLRQMLEIDGASGVEIYVCGPAPLVDAVSDVAQAAGVPADAIIAERFLPPV